MVAHYDRDRLRRNSERPTAITGVLVATAGGGFRTADLPLGLPTCSARSRRGLWALYPAGDGALDTEAVRVIRTVELPAAARAVPLPTRAPAPGRGRAAARPAA